MAKNRALKVGIEDGEVVIRIGVGVLRTAAEAYEGFSDGEGEKVLRILIRSGSPRRLFGSCRMRKKTARRRST